MQDKNMPLNEEQTQQAADLLARVQPLIGLVTSQFSEHDIDLMEASLNELEASMRGRQTLAELFGRSAFNQSDQNITAKMPALRQFIALAREVAKVEERSKLHIYGEDIFA